MKILTSMIIGLLMELMILQTARLFVQEHLRSAVSSSFQTLQILIHANVCMMTMVYHPQELQGSHLSLMYRLQFQ